MLKLFSLVKPLQPFGAMLEANAFFTKLSQIRNTDIEHLMRTYKLIILRGFDALAKSELVQYAKSLGDLLEWSFGQVMEMKVDGNAKNYLFTEGRVPLHWDGAFLKEPRWLLFHCLSAPHPNHGGETFFANTDSIIANLSPKELATFAGLQITYETEKVVHYGGKISIPLIKNHPYLNNKIMRFAEPVIDVLNPVSVEVNHLSADESYKMINRLTELVYQPRYLYTHTWQNGDILIADNFSLLHGRNAFNQTSARHLRRIQIL